MAGFWCSKCHHRAAHNGPLCVRCAADDGKPAMDVKVTKTKQAEPQPSAVPIGAVCDRHPSALAHWMASLVTNSGVIEQLMCDHCRRISGQDLEDSGWILRGEYVRCTCVTCTPPGDA